ncbi:MAG: DUF2934 domain-containing protein [Deltaproteobacteria bacterium]|jgi:hypothetical protein|nr:DUF2934 domain-containing protein [Deltaproteobacteria bacterium]
MAEKNKNISNVVKSIIKKSATLESKPKSSKSILTKEKTSSKKSLNTEISDKPKKTKTTKLESEVLEQLEANEDCQESKAIKSSLYQNTNIKQVLQKTLNAQDKLDKSASNNPSNTDDVYIQIPDKNTTQPPKEPTPEEISARAYAIWEREGRPHGYSEKHWQMAVEELKNEL